jgi:glutathione S-transferase
VAVRSAGGSGSVPCLVAQNGDVVDDSQRILRWVDAQVAARRHAAHDPPHCLFPAALDAEVTAFCERMDTQLGTAARSWAYFYVLDSQACANAMVAHVPANERLMCTLGFWAVMRPLIRRGYGVSAAGKDEALAQIRGLFDDVAAQLSDGRAFLFGDAFTAADLAFVALAAPALGIPYGPAPRAGDDPPAAMRADMDALRATPAGAFALRVWDAERARVMRPE